MHGVYYRSGRRQATTVFRLWLKLCLALVLALAFQHRSLAAGLQVIETTGRAVIQHQDALDEARRLALEDALYLAALQGGARIDGFSSVTTDTMINDHFVVRPTSAILDYSIINEVIDDQHFAITISAAVGRLPEPSCNERRIIHLTTLAPVISVSPDTPAWLNLAAKTLLGSLDETLDAHPGISLRRAPTRSLASLQRQQKTDPQYDYLQLTRGSLHFKQGEMLIEPRLQLAIRRHRQGIITSVYLEAMLDLAILDAASHQQISAHQTRMTIKIGQESLFRSMDILASPTRQLILRQLHNSLPAEIDALATELRCRKLTGKLQLADGRLLVELGEGHGIALNSLAVAVGTNTPYTILRVSNSGAARLELEPLDPNRDLAEIAGKSVEFMENGQ